MQMSKNTLYTVILASVLLVIVLVFSFTFLVPKGKEYRLQRLEKKKASVVLNEYENWHNETYTKLKELQSKHKNIISNFKNGFDPVRFKKINENYFDSLELSKMSVQPRESEFVMYEVNATSKISSPNAFYEFLTSINKSEWIMSVDFPINFDRDDKMIKSSFTMRVQKVKE